MVAFVQIFFCFPAFFFTSLQRFLLSFNIHSNIFYCFSSNAFYCFHLNIFLLSFKYFLLLSFKHFLLLSFEYFLLLSFKYFFAFLQIFLLSFKVFSLLSFFFLKNRQDKILSVRELIHLKQGIHWTGETMANLPGHPVLTDGETLDQIVKDYFKKGYFYLEIFEYLKTYHGKTMSLSTLKRYFVSENIFVDLCTEGEDL